MTIQPNLPIPAVAIAIPVVSAVLAIVMSAAYEIRKHRKATKLFGKVVAPGPYEDTTLLITDIQVRILVGWVRMFCSQSHLLSQGGADLWFVVVWEG